MEFPGTTALIPDVAGKRILDAGCGTGRYPEWLLDHGADVVAVDTSTEMIQHAAERVGDRAEIRQADLEKGLDFADDEFDGIISALTLHYIENWRAVFAEFARILNPGGMFVFSVNHPVDDYLHFGDA